MARRTITSAQWRLEAASHGDLECPCLPHHALPVTAHQRVKPVALVIAECAFTLACKQCTEFSLLLVAHLHIAQRKHVRIGEILDRDIICDLRQPRDEHILKGAMRLGGNRTSARDEGIRYLQRYNLTHRVSSAPILSG